MPRDIKIEKHNVSRQIVIKIHGWCNLGCKYCYMYTSHDQSWRRKPKTMSREVISQVAERVAEYMREHELRTMSIVLHGGEPLLAGIETIKYLVDTMRAAVPDRKLEFTIQTNGTLLTREVLEIFLELHITVGISLDGDEIGNDQRVYLNGRSSHQQVVEALKLFQNERYRGLLVGLLCVIDLKNDPVQTYEYLRQFGAPRIEFLRPLGNWTTPPPNSYPVNGQTLYGNWLIEVFDHWLDTEGYKQVHVSMFDQILELFDYRVRHEQMPWNLLTEMFGPWVVGAILIETDGTYELLDALNTVKEGEAHTGLNVFDDVMTKALAHMLVTTEQRGILLGSKTCQECKIYAICGGDLYSHRWSEENDYDNPSVYCEDLQELIWHIVERICKLAASESSELA